MVKPELICFGDVLVLGGKPQHFPEDLGSNTSPIPCDLDFQLG